VDRPTETGSTEPRKASRSTSATQRPAQATTRSASDGGGSDISPDRSQRAGSVQRHGLASWYEHPGRTASGEVFKPDGLTAAHRTLPFGTRIRVSNPRNGRSVVVRINDRNTGPAKVAIDLSRGAARRLGITGVGTVAMSVLSAPTKERMAELEGAR
jgi:rare lipoprotein A